MTSNPPTDDCDPTDPPADDPVPSSSDPDADRLALLWNGFEELTSRVDATEDSLAATLDTLSADVDDLKTQLALLLKQEKEKDIKPRRWAARATRKDWDNLIDWVDQLTADYSLLGDYTVPSCWPAHPGVVEELAGLHRSWTRAMIADELAKTNGGNDLTAWHDRWLWPCLRRMKSGHYRTTNCRTQHQPDTGNTRPTDREFLPTASAGRR
jgi:hypothetical protein